jgi:hypothetical protein
MLYGVFPGGASFDPEKDIPSLDGKVIFVTGGRFATLSLPVLKL